MEVNLHSFSDFLQGMEKNGFGYAKTKTQSSCEVTAQLIRAFDFATRILLIQNFKLLDLFYLSTTVRPVSVRTGRKSRPISPRNAYDLCWYFCAIFSTKRYYF